MDDGVRDAFCPLLWIHNGGTIDARGKPITGQCRSCEGTGYELNGSDLGVNECPRCEGSGHDHVTHSRGYCTRAYDCGDCSLMKYQLSLLQPSEHFWLCPDCTSKAYKEAKEKGFKLLAPGFFWEGYCEAPNCCRQGSEQLLLPPRYSVFRQIIIGPLFGS